MNNEDILVTEQEFEILNAISQKASVNQRDLSQSTGFSLGMTNVLVRRLLKKGILKIRQLNKKKVEYLLTPKGFAEKAKKSYRYTLKTINSLHLFKKSISKIFEQEMAQGKKKFVLLGDGDLQDIVHMVAINLDWKNADYSWNKDGQNLKNDPQTVYLTFDENGSKPKSDNIINVLDALSNELGAQQ